MIGTFGRLLRGAIYAVTLLGGVVGDARLSCATDCGDVNVSGSLTAADALMILRAAVGNPASLRCPAPAAPLQTGQTVCYKLHDRFFDGIPIECLGTGQDGEIRAGVERAYKDNGDGTISDLSTGLMWEKLSDDGSIHDKDNEYSWPDAVAMKIAALNDLEFAGYDDWRFPNQFELQSLADLGRENPAVDPIFHTGCASDCSVMECSCTTPDFYASSTPGWGSTNAIWLVDFYGGGAGGGSQPRERYVRAVRGRE